VGIEPNLPALVGRAQHIATLCQFKTEGFFSFIFFVLREQCQKDFKTPALNYYLAEPLVRHH